MASPFVARLCSALRARLLSPSSWEGGLSCRLFLGHLGANLPLGNRVPAEFYLRPSDLLLFEARLKTSYSSSMSLLFSAVSPLAVEWG